MEPLSPAEARVLGTLMEKARTVPDSYPMTLNALVAGCNQKSSRDPITNLTEGEVQEALDGLKRRSLAFTARGSRVDRWEHNFQRALVVPEQSAVLLGLLMLRGPQTPGELRIHSERWYRFADISSVEAFLEEMRDRPQERGGPLVVQLPRAPGAREARWAHLLCGPVDIQAYAQPAPSAPQGSGTAPLEARVMALENEVASLREQLQDLCGQLGLSPPRHPEPNDRA
ncbi:YceH family protein [Ramlibacter ginsenosidimutans]|uniref:YceH family protein n=1 Tax=Ramlibacter ginsenosidimutans TaxID=502333 RepID=A0A934WQ71_9BURK|nr:YceH family protein [Ramlibacter ginsenosidimutans]MBK6009005.1 YceH family protein [Ramlibacter ginsenosidimutans]